MANSDHSLEVIRRSMISGLRGHLRKVSRCEQEGKPFHRTAAASSKSRKLKKLTAKQSWFKTKPKCDSPNKMGDEVNLEAKGDRGHRRPRKEGGAVA